MAHSGCHTRFLWFLLLALSVGSDSSDANSMMFKDVFSMLTFVECGMLKLQPGAPMLGTLFGEPNSVSFNSLILSHANVVTRFVSGMDCMRAGL